MLPCFETPLTTPAAARYRVEVSGWDENETFFVEKSQLEWTDELGKRVALTNTVSDGAMVFLRLLQLPTANRSYPVPYHVEFVNLNSQGRRQFQLRAVSPRHQLGPVAGPVL